MQGDPAGFVLYIQSGRVKLSVVSEAGEEHAVSFVEAGDFIGEEATSKPNLLRIAAATAVGPCIAVTIQRPEMIHLLESDFALSSFFLATILAKNLRAQAALVDQLSNSAENRLAQLLGSMADFENLHTPTWRSTQSMRMPNETGRAETLPCRSPANVLVWRQETHLPFRRHGR